MKRYVAVLPNSIEVVEGPLVEEATEDGPAIVFFNFLGIEVDGKFFEHPHPFRWKAEAEDFRAKVERKGKIDLANWVAIPEGPTLEERLGPFGIEWEREQEERLYGGP